MHVLRETTKIISTSCYKQLTTLLLSFKIFHSKLCSLQYENIPELSMWTPFFKKPRELKNNGGLLMVFGLGDEQKEASKSY